MSIFLTKDTSEYHYCNGMYEDNKLYPADMQAGH